MTELYTVAHMLVDELRARNVAHVFGIPGDYALGLFHERMSERHP